MADDTCASNANDPTSIVVGELIESNSEDFSAFLKRTSLEDYLNVFRKQGILKIEHFQDIEEEDAAVFGLSKFQWRRLKREFSDWKASKKSGPNKDSATSASASYKTSTSSVVLPLLPGFKNYFQTRDGQGNIVVSARSLQNKFKNLWYQNPLNPFQNFSNSFILQMAEYRMQFSKSIRECELWCRKMRQQRVTLMIAAAEPNVIRNWTPYYKAQSVWGLYQQAGERYPEIQSYLDHAEGKDIPRQLFDFLCKYNYDLEKAKTFAKESLAKCEEQIASCTKEPNKNGKNESIFVFYISEL